VSLEVIIGSYAGSLTKSSRTITKIALTTSRDGMMFPSRCLIISNSALSQIWYNTDMNKECRWIGRSHDDLMEFPKRVREIVGYALYAAQCGEKSPKAKPLKGFGPGVLEVVADYDGDTYRAVYTVRLPSAVFVLDVFQKKSKRGIKTSQQDRDRIKQRLAEAIEEDKELRR
jgi:phage-related protein